MKRITQRFHVLLCHDLRAEDALEDHVATITVDIDPPADYDALTEAILGDLPARIMGAVGAGEQTSLRLRRTPYVPEIEGTPKLRNATLFDPASGTLYTVTTSAPYPIPNERGPLGFDQLRRANATRCEEHFHPVEDWSLTDWLTAVAGELGELASAIKNYRRGQTEMRRPYLATMPFDEMAKEAADVVIYLDLLCARAGIDLGEAVREKFNEVSRERLEGCEQYL